MDTSLRRILWLVVAGWVGAVLLSPHLWWGDRTFPLIPLSDFFRQLLPYGSVVPPILLGLLLALACWNRNPEKILTAAVIGIIAYGCLDQMRWQPWAYQYVLLLAVLASSHEDTPAGATRNAFRWIIAGIYLWSGLQKCQLTFVQIMAYWWLEPWMKPSWIAHVRWALLLIPLLEILIAFGLWTNRFRRRAVILATLTHLVVLVWIGPWGRNWNSVVWPWNLVMPALVVSLFWHEDLEPERWWRAGKVAVVAVILGVFAPVLSFWNQWDPYLSWSLYSAANPQMEVFFMHTKIEEVPVPLRPYCHPYPDRIRFDVAEWSMKELNVPVYPAERVYKQIYAYLTTQLPPDRVVVWMNERPDWNKTERPRKSLAR